MNYDLQIEEVSTIRRRLVFTLPPEEVRREVDRAFDDLRRRVRLPGFRPGRVPRKVLDARFGSGVRAEAARELINRAWRQASERVAAVGRASLEDQGELREGEPFRFALAVEVRPEVEAHDYEGVAVEVDVPEVTDEAVDEEVRRRLARLAAVREVEEDRPVREGDHVLVELEVRDGDEVVDQSAGAMVEVPGERYYAGLDGLLVGMRVGEEREADVAFSEEAEIAALRGRTLSTRFKVLRIHEFRAPEPSDEAAKELGHDSLEALRADVRGLLERQVADVRRQRVQVAVLQKLVEAHDFEVPEAMVEDQLSMLVEEMRIRRAWSGQDPRTIRFTEAQMADFRERALFAAKASLILDAVARQEGIEVTDEEMDARIAEMAALRGQTPEAIRGYLERDGATETLRERLLEEKVLDWLVERAQVTERAEAPAEEAAAPAEEAAAPAEEAAEAPAGEDSAASAEAPAARAWNPKMKKAELLEVARMRGLEVGTRSTKADIIAALEASE